MDLISALPLVMVMLSVSVIWLMHGYNSEAVQYSFSQIHNNYPVLFSLNVAQRSRLCLNGIWDHFHAEGKCIQMNLCSSESNLQNFLTDVYYQLRLCLSDILFIATFNSLLAVVTSNYSFSFLSRAFFSDVSTFISDSSIVSLINY